MFDCSAPGVWVTMQRREFESGHNHIRIWRTELDALRAIYGDPRHPKYLYVPYGKSLEEASNA